MNLLFGRFSYQDTLVLALSFVTLTIALWVWPLAYTILVILLGLPAFWRINGNLFDWVRLCVFSVSGSAAVGGVSQLVASWLGYKMHIYGFLSKFIPWFFLGLVCILLVSIFYPRQSKNA